jgi:mannose PTS system EIID component
VSDASAVSRSVFFRALGIQGSWNYESLIGTGFGFAILPALRRLRPDPAELDAAIRRHERPFNTHPYLAPLALGAVIRLERDGEDPAMIERFKAALRGSLGTFGDQLVWAGWRPACVLLALTLLLLGVPWYLAVTTFLVLYNLGHLSLMVWGFKVGHREGRNMAERIRDSRYRVFIPRLLGAGAFLAAFLAALLVVGGIPAVEGSTGWLWAPVAGPAALAGVLWGERARRLGAVGIAGLVVLGIIAGVVS